MIAETVEMVEALSAVICQQISFSLMEKTSANLTLCIRGFGTCETDL